MDQKTERMVRAKSPMILHVNIRKSFAACHRLSENLKHIEDAIVSVNETTLLIKTDNIATFNTPLFCKIPLRRTRAAIYIKGEKYKGILIAHLSTPDVAVANITGNGLDLVLISAYLPPSEEYERALQELTFAVQKLRDKKVIICSDTNSRSPFWNDIVLNARGEALESFAASNDLQILNTDGPHTFSNLKNGKGNAKKEVNIDGPKVNQKFNHNGSSTIDLILANDCALDYRPSAEVMTETYTASDHRMIKIELSLVLTKIRGPFRNTTRKYRTNKANWLIFEENLDIYENIIEHTNFNVSNKQEADQAVERLNEYLKLVCESSIPKLKHTGNRKETENDEIDRLTKLEENLNNRYNRLVRSNKFEAIMVLKELREATKLKTAAQLKHRNECMEKKFTSINTNNDPNEAYKIHKSFKAKANRSCPTTIQDLDGNMTKTAHETTQKLFSHCFPDKNHPKLQKPIRKKNDCNHITITTSEVSASINWMANNKAPGVDGFTPEIIKKSLHKIVIPLTQLYNALLEFGYFPDAWKEGFAIFIPKPNSESKTKTVKDFRPITLLNVLAKVLERLLIGRINKFLLSNNKLNPRQDGFSKQKSTLHSLHSFRNFVMKNAKNNRSTVAIFLDISGAFDNACWQLIIESLINKDCPNYLINLVISYFQDRKVVTNSHNSKLEKTLTQGAPQGSCCGPSLWNILLDSIFQIPQIENKLDRDDFYLKAFADDICLGFAFDNQKKLQNHTNKLEREIEETLDAIYSWGNAHYLDFNIKKTKALAFKSSAYVKVPKIKMNSHIINLDESVKYLGIWFDDRFSFKDHALKTIDKCKKIFNIVRSYCGNTWGLNSYLTRLIYKTIIIPVLTYGASIWYPAFMHTEVSKKIRTLQYYCTKSIVKSYRTASIVATSLLSNTLPLESEIFIRAQVELSRITGAIQKEILKGNLIKSDNYKPLYFYGNLLETFEREDNLISVKDTSAFEFGNPDNLTIEPVIKWADLPVGPDKAPIYSTEDFTKVKAAHDYYIFTDGSSVMDTGTGGSFVIKTKIEKEETLESQALPMHPLCTAFQSELFAIYRSLDWASKNLNLEDKKMSICTDSLSALQKLKSNNNDSLLSFLINSSPNKIASRNCEVSFAKVPAHQEERLALIEANSDEAFFIQGNIDADHMAKIAAKLPSIDDQIVPIYNFISLSTVKRHTKIQLKEAWLNKSLDKNYEDDRAQLNNWILNFIPNANYVNKKLLTLCDYYTSQIVTGHGCFKSYFKRFKITDDDRCTTCKDEPDCPEHILFKCNQKYTRTLNQMGIRQPKDLCKILKSDDDIATFKNLCRTIITDRNNLFNTSVLKVPKPEHKKKRTINGNNKSAKLKTDETTFPKYKSRNGQNKIATIGSLAVQTNDLNNKTKTVIKPKQTKKKVNLPKLKIQSNRKASLREPLSSRPQITGLISRVQNQIEMKYGT